MATLIINFDALKQEHWSKKELDNAKRICDFVQHLMNDHNFDHIVDTYGDAPYVQHNRNIPDGIAGLVKYVGDFARQYPDYTYDVKRILADGDYVVFHSHATLRASDRGNERKGLNISDTWRLDNGQIVEHWDSLQAMDGFTRFYVWLTGGRIRNSNGVY